MSKLIGRKPIELKLSDIQHGYVPLFDSSSKSWGTINRNSLIQNLATTSGSNIFIGNQTISGSVIITGSLEVNGKNYINDSSSFDSRISTNSSSLATFSGSYVNESSSFADRIRVNSASFDDFTKNYTNESASFTSRITTNSASISLLSASFISFNNSYNTGSFTGSFIGLLTGTASYASQALTSSNALTASSADNLTVRGTLTAQTIVAQTITSSIEFITGSTKNGSLLSNTHEFTGSVSITGSLSINESDYTTTSGSTSTRLTILETFSGSYSTGSFTGSFIGNHTGSFSGSLYNLQNTVVGHIPFYSSSQILADSIARQLNNGSGSYSIVINQDNITNEAPEALYVYQPSVTSYNVISGKGNLNNYLQLNIKNTNTGENASSDIVATANNGDETSNYIDMGINSEGFTGSIGDANDAYLYSTGNHLHIGNASNQYVGFFAGGADVDTYMKLLLDPSNLHQMTGSLDVSGSIIARSFTGSLQGTASWANNVINATSASYALTASYVQNANTASYILNAISSSYALTASYTPGSDTAISSSYAITSSYAVTSSYVVQSISASFASTASSVNRLNQNVVISGSLIVTGSTNIIGNSGTTLLSSNADTLIFTGSLYTTGSIVSTGSLNISGGITGSLFGTASYAVQAQSASYWSGSITNAATASYVQTAQTASYALNAVSASYALTSSYLNPINNSYLVLSQVSQSLNYQDDTEAAAGGVPLGGLYRNGNFILIRIV